MHFVYIINVQSVNYLYEL